MDVSSGSQSQSEEMVGVQNSDVATSRPKHTAMELFTAEGFKTLVESTKSSNRLPIGKSRDLYNSYPSFHNIMKAEANNVLSKLHMIMRKAGHKGNIQRRDDEEKFEMIVDANDTILERVGMQLGNISGNNIVTEPPPHLAPRRLEPISGSWNKNLNPLTMQALSVMQNNSKNLEKPQLHFKHKVDNDRNATFEPKIKYKYNLLKPLALITEEDENGIEQFCHPYEFEIERFKPTEEQLKVTPPKMYEPLEKTPLHYIVDVHSLHEVISDLKNNKEIAVDLEHHSYRSFQGFTCLMQISTRTTDYIIDTLSLIDELHVLNDVFTDPKIVKVFHGAFMDIQWLQRDFSIYVVHMFDTYQAAKLLNYPQLSLAYLLKYYCNVDAQKHFQLADWRIRPLSEDMLTYARGDTHYLLYIYDNLKKLLVDEANGQVNLLKSVISESSRTCLTRYVKPVWNEDGYLDIYHRSKRLFDNRQQYALKHLYDWRDSTARAQDESLGYVLPKHMLLHISETLPRETQGILACCNPIPLLVRQHLVTIHQIILKARQQPLEKPVFEERRWYRSTAEEDLSVNTSLKCPHDLTHEGEFRDDLPSLLSSNVAGDFKLTELSAQNLVALPLVDLFEATKGPKKVRLPAKARHLTPYQRYKMVKPFADSKTTKETKSVKVKTEPSRKR